MDTQGKIIQIRSNADAADANNAKRLFCRFKMDGCAHCVNSQGEWDELCKKVEKLLGSDCTIAEVEREMVPVLDLGGYVPEGYPTHSFFENGKFVKDAEERTVQGLFDILKEMNYIQVGQRRRPAKRRQTPAKRRQTPAKRRQTPAKRRQTPAKRRQTPAKRQTRKRR